MKECGGYDWESAFVEINFIHFIPLEFRKEFYENF